MMMMVKEIMMIFKSSVTFPAMYYLSHFTEWQVQEGLVSLDDLVKEIRVEKNWR